MKYNYNYKDDEKNIYITMRKTNWWYKKKIKFCEKNDDCGMVMREINKLNLKTNNEKERHTNLSNAHCISQL